MKHPQFILAADADYFREINPTEMGVAQYPHMNFLDGIQKHLVIAQRDRLENDINFRQLIPAVVIRQKRFLYTNGVEGREPIEDSEHYIYHPYRRLKGVGESRLAGKVSLTYGGHIDLSDVIYNKDAVIDPYMTIMHAAHREIKEEVSIKYQHNPNGVDINPMIEFEGSFIIDTEDADRPNRVNCFHVAIILVITLHDDAVLVALEEELEVLPPMTAIELLLSDLELEGWARMYLDTQV